MNPQIRKLQPKDIDRVYDLGMKVPEFSANVKSKHQFWSKDTLERFVNEDFSLVIEDEDLVIGFLLAVYQPITQKLTWENMYIEPAYQKKGLAKACFEKSWNEAQRKGAIIAECVVSISNHSAQKTCKRLGFNNAGDYQWMIKFKTD